MFKSLCSAVQNVGRVMFGSSNILTSKLTHSKSVTISSNRLMSCGTPNAYDIVIVGGGIIGSGTARQLKKNRPDLNIAIIEKESYVAAHQSGNNSGVIHAGIYYKPGSLRAQMCVTGMLKMYDYLEKYNIPYKRNGKLIVATTAQEVSWLHNLHKRGQENKVPGLEIVTKEEIREIEPYCVGLKALNSPYTGIVDFGVVTRSYARQFKEMGGKIFLKCKVLNFTNTTEGDGTTSGDVAKYPISIICSNRVIKAGFILTCCGLHADEISMLTNEPRMPQIIPFRGTYYVMTEGSQHLVKGNIYPVPDPSLPFPGVHFTPKLDGSVWCGPTAMIAFKKEGYDPLDFDLRDMWNMAKFRGLRKFTYRHFLRNIIEFQKSINVRAQLKELHKYIPVIKITDLCPGPGGVQAQAMDNEGNLVEDFAFHSSHNRILHCRNAPSPAATSSLAISEYLAEKVEKIVENLN